MKRVVISATLVVAIVATMISCGKYSGYKKGNGGMLYKFHITNKDAAKANENDILTMNMKYWIDINGKDSLLYNSSEQDFPFEMQLIKPEFEGDIFDAISLMHVGDSATFVLNAKDFFVKTVKLPKEPSNIDSTMKIIFQAKLLKSQSLEERQMEEVKKIEELKNTEEQRLADYLKKHNITQQPTDSGYYCIIEKQGTGKKIQKGDYVEMHMTILSIEDQVVFSTLQNNQTITVEYGKPIDTKGFEMALGKMSKGEKAKLVVPSRLGKMEAGHRNPATGKFMIEPYTPIIYDVEIVDVKTKAQYDKEMKEKLEKANERTQEAKNNEDAILKEYLKSNNITTKPTASGMYYIETKKGTGNKAVKGKSVKVHYTGKLLNGKVFDSSLDRKPSEPLEFVIGEGQVIKGWDEGIAMMREGGKAKLIIPSKLAYGERQLGNDIPAFSTLVFDVELVEVGK